ncbi:short-chain dehydrogenase/reductase [Actinoplanes sp. ATCC 53533]|uniref:oxidoreductase n=1 Tax=Actinoplanes sp. ATCC 53533 TaxID=1288362 RepID=UPI000F7ADB1C|nr:oxidoreductase [Actinoplanes sp. ATCC 53533]RSM73289.1 short-chain dehydrogenase/reductase [Actinoplanes sp. ATCC 53533]
MTTTRPVALVTGASSGIGKETALALVKKGFDVIGTSRDTSRAPRLNGVAFLDLDVASDTSATATVKQVINRFGRIDVLVNNAGVGSVGAVEEMSVAQAQAVFEINVFGVMRMVKEVLPHMRAQSGGRIVNLSSVQGYIPAPFMAIYGASKHAIEGYSQSLDHEVRGYGIRVLLVEPAFTNTGFEANSTRPDTPLQAYAQQREAFGRLLAAGVKSGDDPAVIAKVIVAAATDSKPKLRNTAGPMAGRSRILRFLPAGIVDRQIRTMNKLAG